MYFVWLWYLYRPSVTASKTRLGMVSLWNFSQLYWLLYAKKKNIKHNGLLQCSSPLLLRVFLLATFVQTEFKTLDHILSEEGKLVNVVFLSPQSKYFFSQPFTMRITMPTGCSVGEIPSCICCVVNIVHSLQQRNDVWTKGSYRALYVMTVTDQRTKYWGKCLKSCISQSMVKKFKPVNVKHCLQLHPWLTWDFQSVQRISALGAQTWGTDILLSGT